MKTAEVTVETMAEYRGTPLPYYLFLAETSKFIRHWAKRESPAVGINFVTWYARVFIV